jgi:hypothetical protein
MYLGDEAFIETLDRVFDPSVGQETDKWKRMVFADIRTLTGMSNLAVNSKAFNAAKRSLRLWSLEVSGKEPIRDTGPRPRTWYFMPPLRQEEDPSPPEIKEDKTFIDERTELENERKRLIKQQKLLEQKLKQLNKKETQ